MPKANYDGDCIVKKKLPLIFVVDTSKSMEQKCEKTVEVITKTIEWVRKYNWDMDTVVSLLTFNTKSEWIMINQSDAIRIELANLGVYNGEAEVSQALIELKERLTRRELFTSTSGYCVPIILFISSEKFSDDFTKELNELHKNKWYTRAIKVGVVLGSSKNVGAIGKIVGSEEAVLHEEHINLIAKIVKPYKCAPGLLNDFMTSGIVSPDQIYEEPSNIEWTGDWD